jgi:hypothetical protein
MTETMTTDEARKLVDADRTSRVQAAADAVQSILREHECDLVALPQISPDGRVVAVVQIMAR